MGSQPPAVSVGAAVPAWSWGGVDVHLGEALDVLRRLPSDSVHAVVTSPPYYGLRDYGTGEWAGGDPDCTHEGRRAAPYSGFNERYHDRASDKQSERREFARATCPRCGAERLDEQLGLEATPSEYVGRLVTILREARRVLHPTGTLWLVLGDSYASGGGARRAPRAPKDPNDPGAWGDESNAVLAPGEAGLKAKDLIGVPWRVALALQADGWWLRSDIIWAKPAPMPSSVEDRPTSSHEHVFMLAKRPDYFYDSLAVLEPFADARMGRDGARQASVRNVGGREDGFTKPNNVDPSWRGGRNRRDVWTVATQPYKKAHFATFPPKLVEPMIRAGTSERGCCPECLAPWVRIIEKGEPRPARGEYLGPLTSPKADGRAEVVNQASKTMVRTNMGWSFLTRDEITVGWRPTCGCGTGLRPDDLVVVESPAGEGGGDEDPSIRIGRAGYGRPRAGDEARRPMTRHEQRAYAAQVKAATEEVRAGMDADAGPLAVDHYARTDPSGARAIPPALLDLWVGRGWLARVEPPDVSGAPEPVPCTVLDPFAGSGTTLMVARRLGRRGVAVELNPDYLEHVKDRLLGNSLPLFDEVPP